MILHAEREWLGFINGDHTMSLQTAFPASSSGWCLTKASATIVQLDPTSCMETSPSQVIATGVAELEHMFRTHAF